MRLRIANLQLDLDDALEPREPLRVAAARRLGTEADAIADLAIVRRALDARGRRAPRFVFVVEVSLDAAPAHLPEGVRPAPSRERPPIPRVRPPRAPPVIVGAGPAGMFCALALAEAGVAPVVVERGRRTESRRHDVAALYRRGLLDPDSNVSFGEGGAGTFTDGKLSTRVKDPEVREVLERLVDHGADPDILVTHKPHLGSERLPDIVVALREHLAGLGCELRFETRVESVRVESGEVCGVTLAGGGTLDTGHLVLAIGNAGRELYGALSGIPGLVEAKPLAMGLRVEHPQALVDRLQYGRWAGHPALPPADYKLAAATSDGRGVYAFCMCPGGVVVPTPTEPGLLCINGMSNSHRSSRWANSALVAQVSPADFAAAGHGDGVLAGMRLQQDLERRAFEAGGGGFRAPAAGLLDFARGREGGLPARSSYPRGVTPADLGALFPPALSAALREAVSAFGRRLPGFLTEEALLLGAETRTSAPVTLPRDAGLQSPAARGLYPCGEGCGHAGGIVSAAIDGLRVARRILERLPTA